MAKAKKEEDAESRFNPYSALDSQLDNVEKTCGLLTSGMDKSEERQSTGLLVPNLILSRGLVGGGWYTIFGGESCCKSTLASTFMASCVQSNIPIINYWDYEGSQEPVYLEQILIAQGVKVPVSEIFGLRHPETSKWIVKPRVRLYNESIAEKFFDATAKLERLLPDKIKIDNNYYYVYEHTKDNISLLKGKYDKDYYQMSGKMRVPAYDSLPQAVLFVDSFPAMNPEGQDVDDPGSAMAIQARMFSEQIKRIKGKMRRKKVTLVGMNQLRKAPMAYGNPNYEPGGESLKFSSDCRLQVTSRANPHGKGQIDEELSYDGEGIDKYRYIHIKAIKNKLSTPYLEGMMRVWVEDSKGAARGMDPVWDCWQYLIMTGQVEGKRNSFRLKFADHPQSEKTMKWQHFKTLMLGTKEEKVTMCQSIGMKPINIKKACFEQLATGDGLDRYFGTLHGAKSKVDEAEDE